MDKVKKTAQKAKHGLVGVGGWVRRHIVFVVIFILVILAFIGSLVFVSVYYKDKSAPRVTIANVNVGGQNREQVVSTIDSIKNNINLSLTYGGKSATASADDLGINLDTDKLADEIMATSQTNPFGIILNDYHFDLTGSYDKSKVNAFVSNNFPELSTSPKDAQVVYDSNQNKFVVQPGAIGKSVKLENLYAEVEELLANPKLANYEIATSDDQPVVSDQAAQLVADQVNKTLAQTIQVVSGGRLLWTLDPWDIASWVSFTINPDTGSYDIAYDQAKIKEFVNGTVTGQLTNKPVNRRVIADGNGNVLRVISEGKNGQTASNVDSIVSQIYDDLVTGQSGQINMTTKEAPYGTDATVAHDGHWIEYNISTYTVTLWNGNQAVWSTNQTANGKASTPTITGLYTVIRKARGPVCMPNPPSSEPLCNINYVTYWEASGYAFHEAWWMGDRVGQGISHGCINMRKNDAKRVYEWASIGTPVWVHR